ncbi:MAG TPA: FtsQ-type POTRA domain-containing protein [Chloroflexi bacterium]|nr:FtsQ-type POTRA domain-containing protein [Chloroflexota bacterium]
MTVSERALEGSSTRADQVRQRRVRRTRQVERARKVEIPKRRKTRRPRRRVDLVLSAETGAQIQVRALPAGYIGMRIFCAAVLLLCGLTWLQFLQSPAYRLVQPEIGGAQMLTPASERICAGVEGQSLFLVDPRAVEGRLEEVAEVEEATVTLGWPNRVRIALREREPLAAWDAGGRIWWISTDGVAYIQHGERNDLIHIQSDDGVLNFEGTPQDPVISPTVLEAAETLQREFPQVGAWRFDRQRGLGFVDEKGRRVYFGIEGDMRVKVSIYRAIAARLDERGQTATLISVEDAAAPYFSVES